MRYGTVCSGVEAFGPAWKAMGYECAFQAEIAPHPTAVLRFHYPDIPNYGDFTTIHTERIDLLAGGTPCQDFSINGLRKGMAGSKGLLTFEFVGLAERLRPRWLVWENVPGVLSADNGYAFARFLTMLADCGYYASYRVFDAQYFGVAQRRERVFVVAHLGDWRLAAAVLFEPESLRRTAAPGVEAGHEVAGTLTATTSGAGPASRLELASSGHLRITENAVRRLTPLEWERLMGYPDNWTRYGTKPNGKRYEIPAAYRYQMCGNGWATDVANWIAARIKMVDALL